MGNNLSKLLLALILVFNNVLVMHAHGGHEHEDEEDNGAKLISNHPLTGLWTAKANLSEERKFHMGHEHKPQRPVILTLNLCGNGDTLKGTVEQIKLIDAPKKLIVEAAEITDTGEEGEGFTTYGVNLIPRKLSDLIVFMDITTTDIANEMIVSFDNGETSYTATQKKGKASAQCLKLLNPRNVAFPADE